MEVDQPIGILKLELFIPGQQAEGVFKTADRLPYRVCFTACSTKTKISVDISRNWARVASASGGISRIAVPFCGF